ncbi:flagellar biosynthesis anti-sigma factor FlgM [bacterium]|nr:flagellar biosynthesis anti-sigma factor FlgM [bacterium]
MKVDKGGLNRISKKRVAGTQRSEKELRFSDRRKLGGWSGRDGATLSEMARILAKTCSSLKEVPDVRIELVDGLKKEINAGTYKVPVEALAKKLLPLFQID